MRMLIKNDLIFLSTLTRHLQALTQIVEPNIFKLLPDCFYVVFDGLYSGKTHCLDYLSSFHTNNTEGYSLRLIAFSLFEDESSSHSNEHIHCITYVLNLYEKTKWAIRASLSTVISICPMQERNL